ncbi:nuclear transport factor 2 family protein [Cytophagaceae bacterium DM2B3-1]|uniref:Nuclear transport factor 2 family protein n=2 Tax=Xanthocytophaga flava TaxID=3048013 RepID=A0ABT7CPC9_9BACT|nr:nuclear transport factor 2 family protein [Xanthocytophaga flavus]MDJ1494842.1 nuclear transport factor 2 family protein [Xanthocytophaga flavus]
MLTLVYSAFAQRAFAQEKDKNATALSILVDTYSQSVATRDSATFYGLFNDGSVMWGAVLSERTQSKEQEVKGTTASNYFEGSYKRFMRGLFRYESCEDKFENIHIIEDGSVASITMDYSFWANGSMTNWGSKYLSLIKRDGKWKITSVIYSLELTKYFKQPSLTERRKAKKKHRQ